MNVDLAEPRDCADHAPRIVRLTAVRKELLGLARGAQARVEDAVFREAGAHQMTAVRLRKIKAAGGFVLFAPFRKRSGELVGDFLPNLVTAGSNTRSERDVKIGRTGPELMPHRLHNALDDLNGCAAPAGVYCSNGPRARIEEQDGNAVGGADSDAAANVIGDQRVAFLLAVAKVSRMDDAVTVNLL
jgi:hypothetical protein